MYNSQRLLKIKPRNKNRLPYDYLDDAFFWHERIGYTNITRSFSKIISDFSYITGQKVTPRNKFFSFAIWQLRNNPNMQIICESGIHYFNHEIDAINY